MTIRMICDGCGTEMAVSHLHADINLSRATRLKDQTHHDWCATCWTTALTAVIERVKLVNSQMSVYAIQRWQDIPVDEPPPFTYTSSDIANADNIMSLQDKEQAEMEADIAEHGWSVLEPDALKDGERGCTPIPCPPEDKKTGDA